MVLRNNRVNPNAKDVRFSVSFGLPDVKRFLRAYVDTFTMGDVDFIGLLKSATVTESDMRHFLECSPIAFSWIEQPWRQQLSQWAFKQMVDEKLLLPSASKENAYIFTDEAFIRRGRPKGS